MLFSLFAQPAPRPNQKRCIDRPIAPTVASIRDSAAQAALHRTAIKLQEAKSPALAFKKFQEPCQAAAKIFRPKNQHVRRVAVTLGNRFDA